MGGAKVVSMFGTTYLCEQVFSVMNLNKTKHCSRLTNTQLNDIVKCAATQDLTPDIDSLVKAKRCQVSGASSSKQTAVSKKKVNQQVGLGLNSSENDFAQYLLSLIMKPE